MSKPVPKFVSEMYGSAHAFRSEKRRQLKVLKKAAEELRIGCAFFPCSESPVREIDKQLAILTDALSVKTWGK